ncbi:hypothetical protein ACFLT5_02830, partial [Chloroflexota bacterium]
MKPIVDGLEAEYTGRVEVERLDIDDPNTAEAKVTYNTAPSLYSSWLLARGQPSPRCPFLS